MNNRTRHLTTATTLSKMTPVGFEPTQLALVELESTPLDHSGKVSLSSDDGALHIYFLFLCKSTSKLWFYLLTSRSKL